MKNCFKLSFVLMAAAALFTGSAVAQDLKIATVDVESLFNKHHRKVTEHQKMNEELARINQESNDRMETMRGLQTQITDLRKQIEDPTIADKVKREKVEILQTKMNEGRAMEQERRDTYERRRRALDVQRQASIQSIREEIMKLVVDYSKTEDYDYVFDTSGLSSNGLPFLVYTKDAADITADIMVLINKDAPAETEEKAAE